ncbi:MAG: hypothetical protein FWE34_06565 [Defluviitaleaceae bacterium]|nr:hypothetical protein [Defluviitaleaceae bacterium]
MERNWDILIIGGASGTGKTTVARALARYYQVDLVRVDNFQVLLEATTTPETFPAIHYWTTHPNWRDEGIGNAVRRLIDAGQALSSGLAAVIEDHLLEDLPMILEGDFILPELAASFEGELRIRSIFIHENDQKQILKNYLAREGEIQQFRANVSHKHSEWLLKSCLEHDIQSIDARPWHTLPSRIINCI